MSYVIPAAALPQGPKLKEDLRRLGQEIRTRRKALKVSATATAESAGISRMTLNRIERGEASVTMGAYLNVASVLGLNIELLDPNQQKEASKLPEINNKTQIRLSDYPQLKKLAWPIKKEDTITPQEALNLYKRNWRHIDKKNLDSRERELIQKLLAFLGRKRLLV